MPKVHANCPEHGNITVNTKDMKLFVMESPYTDFEVASYEFPCPAGNEVINRVVPDHRLTDLLIAQGVTVEFIELDDAAGS